MINIPYEPWKRTNSRGTFVHCCERTKDEYEPLPTLFYVEATHMFGVTQYVFCQVHMSQIAEQFPTVPNGLE